MTPSRILGTLQAHRTCSRVRSTTSPEQACQRRLYRSPTRSGQATSCGSLRTASSSSTTSAMGGPNGPSSSSCRTAAALLSMWSHGSRRQAPRLLARAHLGLGRGEHLPAPPRLRRPADLANAARLAARPQTRLRPPPAEARGAVPRLRTLRSKLKTSPTATSCGGC
jgi:hypothetical protein